MSVTNYIKRILLELLEHKSRQLLSVVRIKFLGRIYLITTILAILAVLVLLSYVKVDDKFQHSDLSRNKFHTDGEFLKRGTHLELNHGTVNKFIDSNGTYVYAIDTIGCKIPEVDPFSYETKGMYHKESYSDCSDKLPLVYFIHQQSSITLNVNQSLLSAYSSYKIFCCYSEIKRYSLKSKPDDNIRFSGCTYFENSVVITKPFIYVWCRNRFFLKVYSNVFAIISPRVLKKKTFRFHSSSTYSVLLIGIDSISKANLERAMPQTFRFLENGDFVSLKGYTKIALNTLPNLMAILAGLNMRQVIDHCDYVSHIDDCYNIWTRFRNMGYVTAYAEDLTYIGSFNCCGKKGFKIPPTELYFRPYMLAAELLEITERGNMYFCTGPETESQRLMNLIKDFQLGFKDQAKFGLFWMNSFSHDDVSMPSAMDAQTKTFLAELMEHLDHTVLFFFSDHGIRFGDIRTTQSGWLEERTPFFYIHIPDSFKQTFPFAFMNLKANSKRLTSGYDVYMTLQDFLSLADEKYYYVYQSLGCPSCQSLFDELSENRTCQDAAIPPEWCVCNVTSFSIPDQESRTNAALVLVQQLNELVASYSQGYKCSSFELHEILFAAVSGDRLLVRVTTIPEAVFEGAFMHLINNVSPKLINITRIDRYASNSWCIESSSLDMFCYCKEYKFMALFKKVFG